MNEQASEGAPSTPNILQPVLAQILQHNDLGISSWYEVVSFNENGWLSYAGSRTFEGGEYVSKWKYIAEINFESKGE